MRWRLPSRIVYRCGMLLFITFNAFAYVESHDGPRYERDAALALSQSVINNTLSAHSFLDSRGSEVVFSQYRGKPLLVSLIFTSCHHVCPTLTKNLAEVVERAREVLGHDSFSVITVGFDTAVDTPARMGMFAADQGINMDGWDFLSADEETIRSFSRELGFSYYPAPRGFDHLSQLTLVDEKGAIYRQIYGVNYDVQDIVEPLKELVFGKRTNHSLVEGWINNIRLFCTIYDPHSGRYEFDYSLFIGIGLGLLALGGIAVFILREWHNAGNRKIV